MPSGNSFAKVIPPGHYSAGQVAAMADVSKSTVLRWSLEGYLRYKTIQVGKVSVRYYTQAQMQKAQKMSAVAGQPRLASRARKATDPTLRKVKKRSK